MTTRRPSATDSGAPVARARGLSLEAAVARLEAGDCVAFPTETVWGIAADSLSPEAVAALRAFKGRGDDAPISLLVSGEERLPALGFEVSDGAAKAIAAFWPGPLTLVLPCVHAFAPGIARDDGAVGVRCSPHPRAAALTRAAEVAGIGPLTATSCNRSGEPAATTEAEARAVCGDALPLLDPAACDASGERPSTVADFTGATPRILREGAICTRTFFEALGVLPQHPGGHRVGA